MIEIKGTSMMVLPKFIKSKFGEEEYKRWLESLDEEARITYSGIVLPTKWYENVKFYADPIRKICDLFYGGNMNGAFEAGAYDAENALKGMYKLFVKLGSPEFLVKRAMVVFPTYYRPSAMEVVEINKGGAIVRITQFENMQIANENTILGWIDKAMEISGAKNLKISAPKSLTRGDKYTEITLKWQ